VGRCFWRIAGYRCCRRGTAPEPVTFGAAVDFYVGLGLCGRFGARRLDRQQGEAGGWGKGFGVTATEARGCARPAR